MENTDERLIEFFSKDKSFTDAFKCLFENATDAIYVLDKNGNFVTVNHKAEELTGFKREDFIGKSFRKFISVKSLPRAIRGFPSVIRGKSIRLELELKTAAKKTVLVEVTLTPFICNGKIVGAFGIVRNITERKKAEEALESQRYLETILDSIFSGVVVIDGETHEIVDANPNALETIGASREHVIGKVCHSFICPAEKGKCPITDLRQTVDKSERVLLRADGQRIPILKTVTTIMWKGRKYLIESLIDITERKQMEKKLEEYSQHLEELIEKRTRQLKEAQEQLIKSERLAAIGQVAAMVGHDLRNPLTGIKGAAYYLKKKLGPKMDERAREMVKLIEKDIEHSNEILTDLMEYSKEILLELTETTPKSIVREALSLVEVPENVQVLDLTQGEPKIKMDVEKMKRVFDNLVKNAVDAMPNGGKLTITSHELDGNVELAFADTGIGMTKEIMQKIRTPFFTTKAKGMGLGLAICKHIIEAHGGSISVESTVGKGTTFTVTIPIKPKIKEGGEKLWVNVPESLLSTTTKA